MRSRLRPALLVVLPVLLLAGCRQADGPVPVPDAGTQGDLRDIQRGLQYIASGSDPSAPADFAADLRKYVEDEEVYAVPAVNELSQRTTQAVKGTRLPDQTAQRLAHNLWLAIMAREMSDRQTETLQNDTQSLLMSVGVAEPQAQQVAAQVGEVRRALTSRVRRWYEWF
ncbi:MAG: hypothetical protein HYY76_00355 [Acidobacteria bacterium]|nr:hypothetical protein [Acidobacteriota bacterium]